MSKKKPTKMYGIEPSSGDTALGGQSRKPKVIREFRVNMPKGPKK